MASLLAGAERGQGEPSKDREAIATAGPSDDDPGTETSARHKKEDEAEDKG